MIEKLTKDETRRLLPAHWGQALEAIDVFLDHVRRHQKEGQVILLTQGQGCACCSEIVEGWKDIDVSPLGDKSSVAEIASHLLSASYMLHKPEHVRILSVGLPEDVQIAFPWAAPDPAHQTKDEDEEEDDERPAFEKLPPVRARDLTVGTSIDGHCLLAILDEDDGLNAALEEPAARHLHTELGRWLKSRGEH